MFHHISRHAETFRSFYDEIGKTAVIYPVALLTAFGLGLTNLGVVFFARDIFHASPAAIGWLAGTWAVAYTISCVSLRPVLERFRPSYLIIASSFLMFAFILAMQFVSSLPIAFVLLSLYGISMSMFWPPLMARLSDGHEGASLGHRFSRYNIMWSFGNTIGPFACGWLVSVFVLGAAMVLPKATGSTSSSDLEKTDNTEEKKETMLRFPAWVGLFASFFGLGAMLAVFPLAAGSNLGIEESSVGLLFLFRALLSAITFFFIGKAVFWHFRAIPMLLGQILAAGCFALLCFCHNVVSIGVFFALLGTFAAFSYSVSVFHGVSGSVNRAKRMAIHESTLAFGIISGSAASGMLYEISSMAHVYMLCAAVILTGAIVQTTLCLRIVTTQVDGKRNYETRERRENGLFVIPSEVEGSQGP